MPHSEFPEQKRRDQEPARKKRQEHVDPFGPSSQDIQERIVLYQCVGHEKCGEQQHLLPIDPDRIPAELSCPVCEYIHKFQALQRKEAKRGVDQEQGGKDGCPSDQHKDHGKYFGEIPINPALKDAVYEHHNSLKHSAEPGKLEFASQYLDDLILRAYQYPVEFPASDHTGELIKSSGKHFCKGEFHQHDGKTQQDLAVGESLHTGKSLEHEEYAQKSGKRDQKLSKRRQEKGSFILYHASDIDGYIMEIKTDGAVYF